MPAAARTARLDCPNVLPATDVTVPYSSIPYIVPQHIAADRTVPYVVPQHTAAYRTVPYIVPQHSAVYRAVPQYTTPYHSKPCHISYRSMPRSTEPYIVPQHTAA